MVTSLYGNRYMYIYTFHIRNPLTIEIRVIMIRWNYIKQIRPALASLINILDHDNELRVNSYSNFSVSTSIRLFIRLYELRNLHHPTYNIKFNK